MDGAQRFSEQIQTTAAAFFCDISLELRLMLDNIVVNTDAKYTFLFALITRY